jgi:hypothetical protein
LVSHVTVTDRHHALGGQLLPLVSVHSARGPAYIVVALPDGRRRSLRRASTDLAGTAEASSLARVHAVCDGPRVSIGTLLPLARHIVARLAIAVEEVTRDDHARLLPSPSRVAPPTSRRLRPWPNLPSETQTQIAHLLGELLRRMEPTDGSMRETSGAERRGRR